MKIIVDSNIVFSSLLKTQTTFGQIIFNSDKIFDFYSARFLHVEIKKHWSKLKKLSKLSDNQLEEAYHALLQKITFVNEEIIPQRVWQEAETLAAGIDLDDISFIALSKFLRGRLWTGDKVLRDGLKQNGFRSVMNTPEILKLWTQKKNRQT